MNPLDKIAVQSVLDAVKTRREEHASWFAGYDGRKKYWTKGRFGSHRRFKGRQEALANAESALTMVLERKC